MLLEIEKADEGIFQQAINFWYEFDNQFFIDLSTESNYIYDDKKRMTISLDRLVGKFFTFFLQNAIGYEQDYLNFLSKKQFVSTIKKMAEIQSNMIYLHISQIEGTELFFEKLRIFFELFGEGTLFDSRRNIVYTMKTNSNTSDNPLELIGYPRWHVLIRAFSLLDPINPHLWLDLNRSLFLAYEIQAKLAPGPYKNNNPGFTISDYEWLQELRYYCSNLQFKEIDLLFCENFRKYIKKFSFK